MFIGSFFMFKNILFIILVLFSIITIGVQIKKGLPTPTHAPAPGKISVEEFLTQEPTLRQQMGYGKKQTVDEFLLSQTPTPEPKKLHCTPANDGGMDCVEVK